MTPPNPPAQQPSIAATDLEALISTERFSTYLRATADPARAVALYRWNAQVSGAFAELLQHVEVLVRNASHNALSTHHDGITGRQPGAAWFDSPSWVKHHWFNSPALDSINKATRRAHHTPATPRPGKVVSELNFGFWRYLVSDRYEQSLWVPALDGAFSAPGSTSRDRRHAVEDRLAPLHTLRNRIAHCEPIFGTITYQRRRTAPIHKPLEDLYSEALDLVGWISPTAATWIANDVNQVDDLLKARP